VPEDIGGRLNILYVSPEASFTGAPLSILSLGERLDRKRFNPFFLFLKEGPLLEKLRGKGIPLEVLRRPYAFNLFQFLRKRKVNLLHINTVVPLFAGLVGKILKLPLIWHIREDLHRGFWNKLLVKIVESLADKIIVNSDYTGRVFKKREKIITIYNGLDLNKFHPALKGEEIRKKFNINLEAPIAGTIGNFTPVKGYQYFLEAAKEIIRELPRVKFLILGTVHPLYRKYYEKMKGWAKKLEVGENLIFLKDPEDVPKVIASFDLFLLSSVRETLGRVIIEAMACGKPVVATRVGGIPEVVEEGITGYLVPPGDSRSLATAALKLFLDKEKASRMGKEGRRRVEKLFEINKIVEKVTRVYEGLINV
jgi:glycosyltransferase involved in cell wall biosynthesis